VKLHTTRKGKPAAERVKFVRFPAGRIIDQDCGKGWSAGKKLILVIGIAWLVGEILPTLIWGPVK